MRRLIVLAVLAITVAGFATARADGSPIFASGGDRSANSFTTPVVVTPVGGPLTFLNGDTQPHGVSSDAIGPSSNAWCAFFPSGACPLFWAPVTDAGFRQAAVKGLAGLVSGQQYGFYCTLHPNMRGVLIAT